MIFAAAMMTDARKKIHACVGYSARRDGCNAGR